MRGLKWAILGVVLSGQAVWAQMPMEKHGSCPSGYHQSGDYCLASSDSSKPAMPKSGSCPSGYHQSGDYCLKS